MPITPMSSPTMRSGHHGRRQPADSNASDSRGNQDQQVATIEIASIGIEPEPVAHHEDGQQQRCGLDGRHHHRQQGCAERAGHRQAALGQPHQQRRKAGNQKKGDTEVRSIHAVGNCTESN